MNIKIYDCIPPTDDSDYLRPNDRITDSIDRRYKVPVFDLKFDVWYENSVRLWSKHTEQTDCVLSFDNHNFNDNSSDDSGYDAVH